MLALPQSYWRGAFSLFFGVVLGGELAGFALVLSYLWHARDPLDIFAGLPYNDRTKSRIYVWVRGVARLTRLPVTEKIEGSNPFGPARNDIS